MKNKTQLRYAITQFLKDRNLWEEHLKNEIPTSFENYGGLILFNSPSFSHSKWNDAGDELWLYICSLLKCNRLAIKGHIKDDSFRTPQAKLLFGSSPFAQFIDNGVIYRWNIEKTMFSRGNVTERHRIAHLDCSDAIIVDLYAGIGYFTIPYLVHANAKHVHACEWNPDAVESLRHNLLLNKVAERCTIYEGDNRLVSPRRIANRVNLGLIPSSEDAWETACQVLLPTGGILYVHQNVESNIRTTKISPPCYQCSTLRCQCPTVPPNTELPSKIIVNHIDGPLISDCCDRAIVWKWSEWFYFSLHLSHVILNHIETFHGFRWKVCVTNVFKVKSYAPHIDHLVFAVECDPLFD